MAVVGEQRHEGERATAQEREQQRRKE